MAYFKFEDKKVYYKVIGQGTPLLFLHGNTASSKMFLPIVKKYSKDFMVILIDFPGHGKSDRLKRFETDFWFYNSKACYALLEELQLERVSVIGTSGGALVGINLCLEHPERIKHLIADSFEGEYPLTSYISSLRRDRNRSKKKLLARIFWFVNHGFDWKKIVDLDTEMLLEFTKTGQSFYHKPISDLSVPTLLTGSLEDEYCDHFDQIYEGLKKKNSALTIHLFESGTHPAMLSNKEAFYDLVRENNAVEG